MSREKENERERKNVELGNGEVNTSEKKWIEQVEIDAGLKGKTSLT